MAISDTPQDPQVRDKWRPVEQRFTDALGDQLDVAMRHEFVEYEVRDQ
jgi:hypothetical protein